MEKSDPVGIFDSGLGGLTVWQKVAQLLPGEDIIYYGDNLNCPYGGRSEMDICRLTENGVNFLLEKGCKAVVIACNTATAAAIEGLREEYPIDFIGMEPAVKPASINSRTSAVGVLATRGTFNGRLFNETSKKYASDVELVMQIGEGLVELVEKGKHNSPEAEELLRKYLTPMVEKSVDHIVLGCTHYPFFRTLIGKLTGNRIDIIDPAPAVAKQLKRKLENRNLLNGCLGTGSYSFYFTEKTGIADQLIKTLSNLQYSISRI